MWLAAMTLAALSAACGQREDDGDDAAAASPAIAAPAAIAASIASPPWLRDRLPADTIAYLRVPSPWGLLSAPNGRVADAMFASAAHVDAVERIRRALATQPVLAEALGDDEADTVIRALNAIGGPIEAAVVAAGKAATPAAQVLVGTRLASNDAAAAGAHLRALFEPAGGPEAGFDGDGFIELTMNGTPLIAHFDAATARLHLLGGMNAGKGRLAQLLAETQSTREHPAHVLEREIDAGGQGLVVWIDVQSAKSWLMASLAPDRLWTRHLFEQTQALAYGWGSVGGHGRLSLRLALKDPVWWSYLPQAPRRLDLLSAGEPGFVIALTLPVADDVERIVAAVGKDHGAEAVEDWRRLEADIERNTGLTLADWLRPFGPELLVFSDDAGVFSAVRLHDPAAFERALDTLVANGGRHEVRRIGATDIHHLSARGFMRPSKVDKSEQQPPLLAWLQQLPSHGYWLQEGDWLLIASVPQPLIDRAALAAQQPIDAWLERTQGSNRSEALLSMSGQGRDLSRFFYYGYLGLLASLGDAAGSPTDLYALPTARQLGLPRDTGIGLQLVADDRRIALDVNYEHIALDGLFDLGGAYGTVAIAGILAAIAVPAYQDYTVRATVASALAGTASMKTAVAEHHARTGELPGAHDLDGLVEPSPPDGSATIVLNDGAIFVRFNAHAAAPLAGRYLYLLPYTADDGRLHFACAGAPLPAGAAALVTLEGAAATDIEPKHLPADCRG